MECYHVETYRCDLIYHLINIFNAGTNTNVYVNEPAIGVRTAALLVDLLRDGGQQAGGSAACASRQFDHKRAATASFQSVKHLGEVNRRRLFIRWKAQYHVHAATGIGVDRFYVANARKAAKERHGLDT